MPMITVIIVNFNGGDYPQKALDSLKAQTCQDFEVIFIDNASTDGSAETIDGEGLPAFRILRNHSNLGFAAANNLGASLAQGDWLALLNPDAIAAPDWLERLLDATRRRTEIVHFASAQFEMHRPDILDGVGDNYLVFGIPWRGGYGRKATDLPQEGYCFSPCGAGAFYRRDVFMQLDGFDERFFCYCEDVDLGYRMQLLGHDCMFLPDAVIHHAGGGLSGKVSGFATYHGTRNRLWTYLKNTPGWLLIVTLPVHLALTAMIILRRIRRGDVSDALRGFRDGVAKIPDILQEDKWRAPKRRINLLRLARRMAWNPLRMLGRKSHVRSTS